MHTDRDLTARSQRLLVSVRGPTEAIAAAQGGAHIADVEYPASALGTPYPLNIRAVRDSLEGAGYATVVSTNIGETQHDRSSACQAALGVATAGADLVKFGLAGTPLEAAVYLASTIVRTVKYWHPAVKCFPAVFVDEDLQRYFRPFEAGPVLAEQAGADGLLVDTFNKSVGRGLLDYSSLEQIERLSRELHSLGKQAWIAGSITFEELPGLWKTGVDVVCVRAAACRPGAGIDRFGEVATDRVQNLVRTIPT